MFAQSKKQLDNRFRRWVSKRQGVDGSAVTLNRRRIYILPSKPGLVFAGLVLVMLLAAMNYSNSLGFALTFLLASLGFLAMHQCHATLDGLQIKAGSAHPVFAGQHAIFTLQTQNNRAAPRFALRLQTNTSANTQTSSDFIDLPGTRDTLNNTALIRIALATHKRGYMRAGRLRLNTTYPFGLFNAWTWLHMPLECLVYPAPASSKATPPAQGGTSGQRLSNETGQDDFSGLRPYQKGDSPRHIAWQAYARERGLQVKQFSGQRGQIHWLDWNALPQNLDTEARLSILCRQVLDAHQLQENYGLRLPTITLEPAAGEEHKHRCLKALALFNVGV